MPSLLLAAAALAVVPAIDQDSVVVCAANIRDHTVTCFDASTGQLSGLRVGAGDGGLRAPTGIAFGPDGNLYVSSSGTNQVLRYDGESGKFIDVFVSDTTLAQPFTLIFGPDGNLYVSSGGRHFVGRYNGRTGERIGVAARSESLKTPIGLAFDPEGRLLVANAAMNNVARFDPATGEPMGILSADSLRFPSDLAFDLDGTLLVSSAATGSIVRFDRTTGAFAGYHGKLPDGGVPVGIRVLPDGALLVADFAKNRIYGIRSNGGAVTLLVDRDLAGPENLAVKIQR